MFKKDAVAFFGTQEALAQALGIRTQSITSWGEVVPDLRQLQLERLTEGRLKADPAILTAPATPDSDPRTSTGVQA